MKATKARTAKVENVTVEVPLMESYANVWDAVADTPEQAANLRARSELMRQIAVIVKDSGPSLMPHNARTLISLGLSDFLGFSGTSLDVVMVERRRIELPTSALRTQRSPS